MSVHTIVVEPLASDTFRSFGNVIEAGTTEPRLINQGMCKRYDDLADLDHDPKGRVGLSVFKANLCSLPYRLSMLERHPLGPQAFLPLDGNPFLVIVAEDHDGHPSIPKAFMAGPNTGVCYRRNTWHGALTPLKGTGLFAVADWYGEGENLEEYWLDRPVIVIA